MCKFQFICKQVSVRNYLSNLWMLPFQYDEAVVNWQLIDTHAVSVTRPALRASNLVSQNFINMALLIVLAKWPLMCFQNFTLRSLIWLKHSCLVATGHTASTINLSIQPTTFCHPYRVLTYPLRKGLLKPNGREEILTVYSLKWSLEQRAYETLKKPYTKITLFE